MKDRYQILQGDCREALKSVADESVQCCVTSPPYFGLRNYGGGGNEIGIEDRVEDYVQSLVDVFREVRRTLRPDGTLWLNLGDSYMAQKNVAPPPQTIGGQRDMPTCIPGNRKAQNGLKHKDLIGIPWRVAFALQADGWWLRQDIIWHKPAPCPESVEDRCTKAHEYIFLMSKKAHYYYNHESIKESTIDGNSLKNKRSVWTVNTKGYKGAHFATYPKELVLPCVLAGCPEGGTVLDPFNGSGTTGVVALQNKRKYIGVELNPEYVKLAEKRIVEEVSPLTSLFE